MKIFGGKLNSNFLKVIFKRYLDSMFSVIQWAPRKKFTIFDLIKIYENPTYFCSYLPNQVSTVNVYFLKFQFRQCLNLKIL